MPLTIIICLIGGMLWGVLFRAGMASAGLPIDAPTALLGGLVFGSALFLFFQLMERRQNKRIKAAAQKLPSPPSHSFIALLIQGRIGLSSAVYLCADCLCLVNLEQQTLPVTVIRPEDFIRAEVPSPNQLVLHLTKDRSLSLRTAASEMLFAELKTRGWLPFQH